MKSKFFKYIIAIALVLGIVSSIQTTPASAAVENGFYVKDQLDLTVDQFIKYSTTEKVKYLQNKNAFLVMNGDVLEAKLIITATDKQIEDATMSLTEYEDKIGVTIGGKTESEFKVIRIE